MKFRQGGFTMVELLMAMVTASIVMAAIFTTYQVQVRGKRSQEMMTEMQQGARAALTIMEREIRLAGCDPTRSANARVVTATPNELAFTMDFCDSFGDPRPNGVIDHGNEDIRYALTNDADADGVADGFPCNLGREIGGMIGVGNGLQPICENVEAINFVYLDGNEMPLNPVTNPGDIDLIRAVQITLVVRADERLMGTAGNFTNSRVYRNEWNDVVLPAQNDNVTRLMFTTRILCRNLGLDVAL